MPDARRLLGLLACVAVLAGCAATDQRGRTPSTQPTLTPEAALVFGYLSTLEALAGASPAAQAELAERFRRQVATEPTTSNRLRWALILGLPGHGASDPVAARTELGALLAAPERLLPTEVSLATVMYHDVNARLALTTENQRLADKQRTDNQETVKALSRRLQAQVVENARLREQLDAALAKLEAVADLERSLAERGAAPRSPQP